MGSETQRMTQICWTWKDQCHRLDNDWRHLHLHKGRDKSTRFNGKSTCNSWTNERRTSSQKKLNSNRATTKLTERIHRRSDPWRTQVTTHWWSDIHSMNSVGFSSKRTPWSRATNQPFLDESEIRLLTLFKSTMLTDDDQNDTWVESKDLTNVLQLRSKWWTDRWWCTHGESAGFSCGIHDA